MERPGDRELRQEFTIGVEEEYQLVEPGTGELRSRGGLVRRADLSGEVVAEVQDTMLEIGTPVCADAGELSTRLRERRFQASAAASAEDLEIVAAGTHPFSTWEDQVLSEGDRPRMLIGIFRQLLRQQTIWGMHVHVAIPPRFDRIELLKVVRAFSPHLLALSCSSPFHLGADTGFASFRTVSWRGFPFVGAPPRFDSAAEYDEYVALLQSSGAIPDQRTLYWSTRPSPRYPTLELRMCDACPRIADALAIAALARAVVVAAAENALRPIGTSLSPSLQDEVLRENEWIAGRDGLGASLIAPEEASGGLAVREAIDELITITAPIAERLGDAEAFEHLGAILTGGNAADRMRGLIERGGEMRSVVDWLVQETRAGTGIDRRSERRDEPAAERVSIGSP